MGQLNLYKIDFQKNEEFEVALREKYDSVGNIQTIMRMYGGQELQFDASFFIDVPYGENFVEWNWLLDFFGNESVTSRSNPKGILVIMYNNEFYACTYGFSYFIVDKYCDTNFAFEFARRVTYKQIKTTTLLSPGTKRNKAVNTYIDYNNLEFDSGESFAKLKVKVDLPEEFELFKPGIEVGRSIKFEILNDRIETILDVLIYVKETLAKEENYKIPVFNKVSDKELLIQLNDRLADSLNANPLLINLSELDIIGVNEIFNNNDSTFKIYYKSNSIMVTTLISEYITDFIRDCELTLYEGLEKVKIVSYYNNISVRTEKLYDLIDYTDDDMRCVLAKGKWYYFNDDYLGYLAESLNEIDVIYDPQYDYTTILHEQFISERYEEEKDQPEYSELTADAVKEKIQKKYYRERAYNMYISDRYGYECHDREGTSVGGATIELMDLYKDETIYAVKIGNSSSALCYAVDQSLSTLKLYKQQQIEHLPISKRFGVWLLLDRRTHLELNDDKPNINQLKMLSLKNRLDAWKKEVRISGYTPIIIINYLFQLSETIN